MTITIGPATPVEINQLAEEFEQALELYQEEAPGMVLEIGTAAGGTLYHWLQYAAVGADVISVDIDMSQLTQETADSWVPEQAGQCVLIQGDTRLPWVQAGVMRYAPFDWLFIDGSHEYEYAYNDWDAFSKMCNPGAHVLFHDIALKRNYAGGATAGVERLWRELQADGYWTREIRADPSLTEYGIGVLRLP